MGRAPIDQLFANTGTTISLPLVERNIDTGEIAISGQAKISGQANNNPYLRPFYANQFDISYEKYFTETDGAISIALFYKDIRSFVDETSIDPYDFNANGIDAPETFDVPIVEDVDDNPLTAASTPFLDLNGNPAFVTLPLENGNYSTAFNHTEGGYIRGLEVSYTQMFSSLPSFWSGLGTVLSYSHTETETVRIADSNRGVYSSDLRGLSPKVILSTLFWDSGDGDENAPVTIDQEKVLFKGDNPANMKIAAPVAGEYQFKIIGPDANALTLIISPVPD